MTYLVERARPEDLEAALELLRRAGLPERGVAQVFKHYLVVRDAARLVGVCGLEPYGSDALLRSVVVDAQYRGEGIGEALLAAADRLARELGVSRMYLLTTSAHDYFARAGFVDVPRAEAPAGIRGSWEFQSGCPASSAFMSRGVSEAPPP